MAFETSDGARGQDKDSVLRFAAEHLLPGEGDDVELLPVKVLRKGGRGCVAECQPFTISGNPIGVRNANTEANPTKYTRMMTRRIRSLADTGWASGLWQMPEMAKDAVR